MVTAALEQKDANVTRHQTKIHELQEQVLPATEREKKRATNNISVEPTTMTMTMTMAMTMNCRVAAI